MYQTDIVHGSYIIVRGRVRVRVRELYKYLTNADKFKICYPYGLPRCVTGTIRNQFVLFHHRTLARGRGEG